MLKEPQPSNVFRYIVISAISPIGGVLFLWINTTPWFVSFKFFCTSCTSCEGRKSRAYFFPKYVLQKCDTFFFFLSYSSFF